MKKGDWITVCYVINDNWVGIVYGKIINIDGELIKYSLFAEIDFQRPSDPTSGGTFMRANHEPLCTKLASIENVVDVHGRFSIDDVDKYIETAKKRQI